MTTLRLRLLYRDIRDTSVKTININIIFNLQSLTIQIYKLTNNILTIKTNIEIATNI